MSVSSVTTASFLSFARSRQDFTSELKSGFFSDTSNAKKVIEKAYAPLERLFDVSSKGKTELSLFTYTQEAQFIPALKTAIATLDSFCRKNKSTVPGYEEVERSKYYLECLLEAWTNKDKPVQKKENTPSSSKTRYPETQISVTPLSFHEVKAERNVEQNMFKQLAVTEVESAFGSFDPPPLLRSKNVKKIKPRLTLAGEDLLSFIKKNPSSELKQDTIKDHLQRAQNTIRTQLKDVVGKKAKTFTLQMVPELKESEAPQKRKLNDAQRQAAIAALESVKWDWAAAKEFFLNPQLAESLNSKSGPVQMMWDLVALREEWIEILVKAVVAEGRQIEKVADSQLKEDLTHSTVVYKVSNSGSADVTSDYDFSFVGPGEVWAVKAFNQAFRDIFIFESGKVFDVNAYTWGGYSPVDPKWDASWAKNADNEVQLKQKLEKFAEKQNAEHTLKPTVLTAWRTSQDRLSLIKFFRYLHPLLENEESEGLAKNLEASLLKSVNNVTSNSTEGLSFVNAKKEAYRVYGDSGVIQQRVDFIKAGIHSQLKKGVDPLQQKILEDLLEDPQALQLRASNDLYADRLEKYRLAVVQRDAMEDLYVALKPDKNGKKMFTADVVANKLDELLYLFLPNRDGKICFLDGDTSTDIEKCKEELIRKKHPVTVEMFLADLERFLENKDVECKRKQGEALLFASEPYNSQGAMYHNVVQLQMGKNGKESPLFGLHTLVQGVNENLGDFLKDYVHYADHEKNEGLFFVKSSKYLHRFNLLALDALKAVEFILKSEKPTAQESKDDKSKDDKFKDHAQKIAQLKQQLLCLDDGLAPVLKVRSKGEKAVTMPDGYVFNPAKWLGFVFDLASPSEKASGSYAVLQDELSSIGKDKPVVSIRLAQAERYPSSYGLSSPKFNAEIMLKTVNQLAAQINYLCRSHFETAKSRHTRNQSQAV